MRRAGRGAGSASRITAPSGWNSKNTTSDGDRAIKTLADKDDDLPILTEAVPARDALPPRPSADDLLRLESRVCAECLTLADQLIHEACRDVEDIIAERVMAKLRSEMPSLVSHILADHFQAKE